MQSIKYNHIINFLPPRSYCQELQLSTCQHDVIKNKMKILLLKLILILLDDSVRTASFTITYTTHPSTFSNEDSMPYHQKEILQTSNKTFSYRCFILPKI